MIPRITTRTQQSLTPGRRGAVIAVLVVVMALMALVVVALIRPVSDESSIAAMRVETVRAFYAAESGVFVVTKGYIGETTMPAQGSTLTINGQRVEFTQVPIASGVAVIRGLSGDASRRIELELQ